MHIIFVLFFKKLKVLRCFKRIKKYILKSIKNAHIFLTLSLRSIVTRRLHLILATDIYIFVGIFFWGKSKYKNDRGEKTKCKVLKIRCARSRISKNGSSIRSTSPHSTKGGKNQSCTLCIKNEIIKNSSVSCRDWMEIQDTIQRNDIS